MTGNEYQELAARTINKGLTFEEQKFHALHGMVGEIGEIHSIYQKMRKMRQISNDLLLNKKYLFP